MILYSLRLLFILLVIMISSLVGVAQSSSESFGKNRIQLKTFEWKYLATQNFDVYYYDNEKELASYAAHHAEENFDRISNTIGFSPYSKIKLLVYTSIADLHQSNIGLQDNEILIGGYTNFVKSRVEVAFRGSRSTFNTDISKGISEAIINVMMYGGSLKDVVQSSYLLALPDWFLQGASRYIAEGWSIEMDNYVRDKFLQKHIGRPSHMEGEEAYIIGHSIWNFIGKKYGEDNIANILNLTRIVRDEEESIESTLGISFETFISEWANYYRSMANQTDANFENPLKEERIKRNFRKTNDLRNLLTNKLGDKVAYSTHYRGKFKIIITDSIHAKRKIINRGGYKLINQPENTNVPLLSWQDDTTLTYITSNNGKIWLRTYNSFTKKKTKIELKGISEILSLDFSDDGKSAIVSGVRNGKSDIFLYTAARNRFRQITDDTHDDLYPYFLKNSLGFVFSSNRTSDTLTRGRKGKYASAFNYNIYQYNPDSAVQFLTKLTSNGNNLRPQVQDSMIYYVSDRNGIYNIFQYALGSSATWQLTNFSRNLASYSFDDNDNLYFTMLDKGRENIYKTNRLTHLAPGTAANTARQQYLGLHNERQTKDFIIKSPNNVVKEDDININEFRFESDKKNERTSPKKNEEKIPGADIEVFGPYKPRNLFSVDKIVSTIQIDPLRGLGLYLEGGLGDMFGNHKMDAGLFQSVDLRSNGVYGEYSYLQRRIDFKVRFDRNTYYLGSDETVPSTIQAIQRYTLNRLQFTASYPLSVFDRVSFSPFASFTRAISYYPFLPPDVTNFYNGFNAEYVYDNTEVTGMNMIAGSKLKVGVEQSFHLTDKNKSFGRFTLDLRHYQPIHKEIIFATRLSYGSFLGKARKNFLLGGMDNWVFNSTNHTHTRDPLEINRETDNSDILFNRFITSLRGFEYNTVYGPKYVLFNAEMRIPIVRYLYRSTITSNFFRNLQLVGFTDVGSAWSGNNPFNKNNNINKRIISEGRGTFVSTVFNYNNPFLIGYGFGARTLFLGYYVKFDLGWGLVNNQRQDARFYLTLGYDF